MLEVARQNSDFGGMYFDRDGRLTLHVLKSGLAAADGFSRLAGMSAGRGVGVSRPPEHGGGCDKTDQHRSCGLQLHESLWVAPGCNPRAAGNSRSGADRHRGGPEPFAHRRGDTRTRRRRDENGWLVSASRPTRPIVELSTAIRPLISVRSRFRPLRGGIQVNFGPGACARSGSSLFAPVCQA